jgi:hypothetical protein
MSYGRETGIGMNNFTKETDEYIILQTMDIHVKSKSFESVLTDKRIVLIDDESEYVNPIPLETLSSIQTGENAIREPVIVLNVFSHANEIRQMRLTFSQHSGEKRTKERDEWVKQIQAMITPSRDQDYGTGIPPHSQKTGPLPHFRPKGRDGLPTYPDESTKSYTIHKNVPAYGQVADQSESIELKSHLIVYCTRCGMKVSDSALFCERCGSKIIHYGIQETMISKEPVPAAFSTMPAPQDKHEIKFVEPYNGVLPDKSPLDRSLREHTPATKQPKSRRKLILICGIVVIIVLIIVFALFSLAKTGAMSNLIQTPDARLVLNMPAPVISP